eukprot:Lithocolla_globosa_v1_NODE_309_length_4559_cov_14.810169.p7 type:complete len:119 gc:universal NODE_309_length_4559_cov_14.810169:635-991(+)
MYTTPIPYCLLLGDLVSHEMVVTLVKCSFTTLKQRKGLGPHQKALGQQSTPKATQQQQTEGATFILATQESTNNNRKIKNNRNNLHQRVQIWKKKKLAPPRIQLFRETQRQPHQRLRT